MTKDSLEIHVNRIEDDILEVFHEIEETYQKRYMVDFLKVTLDHITMLCQDEEENEKSNL